MQLAETVVSVFQGKLMSPREMHEAISAGPLIISPESEYRGRWYLCGDVSEEFFKLVMEGCYPSYGLEIFTTPGGIVFATFIFQLQSHQCRFLLPLSSEKSERFLNQVERTGVYMSLGRNGGRNALLVEFKALPELIGPLQAYSKTIKGLPRDIPDLDLQMAGHHVLTKSSIPSSNLQYDVEHLSVTVILG